MLRLRLCIFALKHGLCWHLLTVNSPEFFSTQAATKDVYGANNGGSLEDTVGRRAAFSERRDAGGAAFRRQ